MKKQLVIAITIAAPVFFVSCISNILKEKPPTFSTEVNFTPPAEPFYQLKKSVFPSWRNKKTGNVIAIMSDCQQETSLTDLHHLIEDSIENTKRDKENPTTFQSKPALSRVVHGELDGVPIEIKSLSFKRLSCGYVVSLSGKPEQLKLDQNSYDLFLKSLTFK